MSELWRRLRALFRRSRLERELEEEMRFHLEMKSQELMDTGAARRQLGNLTLLRELSRENWGWAWLERLAQDLRYGLRLLPKAPGFTAVAVVTLALGIGVNTSVFSLLNALLLRPLPVPQANRVVALYRGESLPCSYQDYLDFRERNHVFSGLAAVRPNESALDAGGASEVILAEGVSINYASVLETKPFLGRWLTAEDERTGAGQFLAVISYRVWQNRLGADPRVLGRQVRLESQWYTVIGVAAKGFQGTSLPVLTDVWVPLVRYARHNDFIKRMVEDRLEGRVMMLGRLKPAITRAQAQAELNVIDSQLRREHPRPEGRRSGLRLETARGISDPGNRRNVGELVSLLMAVAGLVLLVACANIANLLLARGATRRREMSIRLALGAGRARLVRQAMIESLWLALLGAAAGLLAAHWTNGLLERHISSAPLPVAVGANLAMDGRVLGFALAASVLTTLLFGLIPAVRLSQPNLVVALKGDEPLRMRPRRLTLRNSYVVAQVSLSFMLLIVAGLFIRALRNASRLDVGFDPHGLVSVRMYVAKPEFTEVTGRQLFHRVQEHARSLPRVQNATLSYASPFIASASCVAPQGAAGDSRPARAGENIIGTEYFSTMGIPLLRGRDFSRADNSEAPAVVIVNEVLAGHYWPGENPIGRQLRLGKGCDKGQGTSVQIVGVAKDAKYDSLERQGQPYVFSPFDQRFAGYMALILRTVGDPRGLAATVRKELPGLDRRLRVYEVETLSDQIEKSLWLVRWEASMLAAFGLLALSIAAVGLYGVIAFAVSQRTHEIGIRMALGARRRDILRLVLLEGLVLTLMGVALGVAASLTFTPLLRGFLYGLSPTDGVTYTASALLWTAVALLASYIPSYRASKADPMEALRYE